jgi:hypothetical protein
MQDESWGVAVFKKSDFYSLHRKMLDGLFSTDVKQLQELFDAWSSCICSMNALEIDRVKPVFEDAFERIMRT